MSDVMDAIADVYGAPNPLAIHVDAWYDRRYGSPPDDMVYVAHLSEGEMGTALIKTGFRASEDVARRELQAVIDAIAPFASKGDA